MEWRLSKCYSTALDGRLSKNFDKSLGHRAYSIQNEQIYTIYDLPSDGLWYQILGNRKFSIEINHIDIIGIKSAVKGEKFKWGKSKSGARH